MQSVYVLHIKNHKYYFYRFILLIQKSFGGRARACPDLIESFHCEVDAAAGIGQRQVLL